MNNKIKAVIFDWAGTVIDYGCFAPMDAFMHAFEKNRIPISVEEARAPMGLLKRDHIQAILGMDRVNQQWKETYKSEPNENDVNRLYEAFEQALMESLVNFTNPIDGVIEMIGHLRAEGIKIGSTTGYTKAMMKVVAPAAREKGYAPDFIISSDEVKEGRPHPYMIFRNLCELGVYPPKSVVKVGDTVADVQEGKNAGVWSVAVIKGSSELGLTQAEVEALQSSELKNRMDDIRKRFEEAGADRVIESMEELPLVIEYLEQQL